MKKRILTLLFAIAMATTAFAQKSDSKKAISADTVLPDVITIKERNSDNKVFEVDKPFFVDINSMLTVEIDTSILLLEMNQAIGGQTYPVALLNIINNTLRLHQEILDNINTTGSRKSRLEALENFSSSMIPILSYLDSHQKELENTALYQRLDSAFSTPGLGYEVFFAELDRQYQKITADYTQKVNRSSAYFQLGGWLNTKDGPRQFHIPGFDSLADGEIVTKPRFTTSVPPAELQAFNEARNLADSINTNIDGFLTTVKTGITSQVSDVEDKVKVILDGAYTTMENDIRDLASGVESKFSGPVSTLKQDLNDFKTEVVKFVSDVKNAKLSTSSLATLAQDASELYTKGKAIETMGDSIWNIFQAEVKDLPSVTTQLKTDLTNDIQSVVTQLKDLGQPYLEEAQKLMNMLSENRVADLKETAANFSASTFALSYDQVPSYAEVDLRKVGADREPGDQIYFRAVIKRDSTAGGFEKSLFWRKYTMFHMGIHNSIRASIVFLDKVNGDFSGSNNDFQLAPSYSAIFKIGTRHGKFYNQYLTPGLGVNVATMDFDNNNTPEIGIGVTAAFFHDYLQIGYGMNMTTDDNYWMLGLRLPLFGWATSAVQGTPISTSALGN